MKYNCFLSFIWILTFVSFNIGCVSSEGKKQITTLPFFNQPNWTPEWIKKEDSAYAAIHTIPDFSLIDQFGDTFDQSRLKGKIYVANFFFTKCRVICPKMTNNMLVLQEAFQTDSTVFFISHSVTPEMDSVKVLRKYAEEHKVDSSHWRLLTGDRDVIYQLAKRQYFAGDSVGYYQAGNEFLHTENFILIDTHRRIRGVYNGTLLVEIERIKQDILLLKKESAL